MVAIFDRPTAARAAVDRYLPTTPLASSATRTSVTTGG
jgi:hypothetical protein